MTLVDLFNDRNKKLFIENLCQKGFPDKLAQIINARAKTSTTSLRTCGTLTGSLSNMSVESLSSQHLATMATEIGAGLGNVNMVGGINFENLASHVTIMTNPESGVGQDSVMRIDEPIMDHVQRDANIKSPEKPNTDRLFRRLK